MFISCIVAGEMLGVDKWKVDEIIIYMSTILK